MNAPPDRTGAPRPDRIRKICDAQRVLDETRDAYERATALVPPDVKRDAFRIARRIAAERFADRRGL